MSTSTIEEQLAEARHRIDAVHAAAERSLAADLSGDWAAFVAAVESELESWDIYLERLQATVATRAWQTREQAETAIADVRRLRIAVGKRLKQADELSATSK